MRQWRLAGQSRDTHTHDVVVRRIRNRTGRLTPAVEHVTLDARVVRVKRPKKPGLEDRARPHIEPHRPAVAVERGWRIEQQAAVPNRLEGDLALHELAEILRRHIQRVLVERELFDRDHRNRRITRGIRIWVLRFTLKPVVSDVVVHKLAVVGLSCEQRELDIDALTMHQIADR